MVLAIGKAMLMLKRERRNGKGRRVETELGFEKLKSKNQLIRIKNKSKI